MSIKKRIIVFALISVMTFNMYGSNVFAENQNGTGNYITEEVSEKDFIEDMQVVEETDDELTEEELDSGNSEGVLFSDSIDDNEDITSESTSEEMFAECDKEKIEIQLSDLSELNAALSQASVLNTDPNIRTFSSVNDKLIDWGFDLQKYRADIMLRYYENGIQSFIDLGTPTEILVNNLSANEDFFAEVAAWKLLTFNPSDMLETSLDEVGYYETVLLKILQEATTESSFLDSLSLGSLKQSLGFASVFLEGATESTKAEIQDLEIEKALSWFHNKQIGDLNPADKKALIEACEDNLKKYNKISGVLNCASNIMDTCSNVYEYCMQCAAFSKLTEMADDTISILDNMYENCPASEIYLKVAIGNIREVCKNSFLSNILVAIRGMETLGKQVFKTAVGGLWSNIITAGGSSWILVGQALGTALSNLAFSTDATIEQYYVMSAYSQILDLTRTSYANMKKAYRSNPTDENASNYIASASVFFNAAAAGCDFATEYAKTVYTKGWINDITQGSESKEYKEFVSKCASIKNSYQSSKQAWILDDWLYYLEGDYPNLYAALMELNTFEPDVSVTGVKMMWNELTWNLNDGDIHYVTAIIEPLDATNLNKTFSSSDTSVVTVDDAGYCQAKAAGTAVITVTTEDGGYTAQTKITITDDGASNKGEIFYSENKWLKYTVLTASTVSVSEYQLPTFLCSITIPSTVTFEGKTYTVTKIPEKGFSQHRVGGIKNIVIPNSVNFIGAGAFENCSSLTEIAVPDSVISIGARAFAGSGLESFQMPAHVTRIEKNTFSGCSKLTTIHNLNNIIFIAEEAFRDSGLTSFVVPDGITKIEKGTFCGCSSLRNVELSENITDIEESAFYESGLTDISNILNRITTIKSFVFHGCPNLSEVIIPGNVVSIESNAFSCSGITMLSIPNSVRHIGCNAFDRCVSLTSAKISDGIKAIPSQTFRECTKLSNVVLPDSITSIGAEAFYLCSSLTEITFPYRLRSIGEAAFEHCSLSKIVFPDAVTTIGQCAFRRNPLSEVSLGRGIVDIGSAFADTDFSGRIGAWSIGINFVMEFDGTLTLNGYGCVPGYTFTSSSWKYEIESVVIKDGINAINNYAFAEVETIKNVTVPDSVITIGDCAFRNCTALKEFVIPKSVDAIGNNAFEGCAGLVSVEFPDSEISIGKEAFKGCNSLPDITIPASVANIGEYAFAECNGLTSVTIPEGFPRVGDFMFYDCDNIHSVKIQGNVSGIGRYAFHHCDNLVDVTIEEGMAAIADSAFSNCPNLSSVKIADSVTSIGIRAFSNCSSLSDIRMPKNLTIIEDYAFASSGLTSLTIPINVTKIGVYAFNFCNNLTSVTIPSNVTVWGERVFYCCKGLKSVIVQNGVKSIGDHMFTDCESLSSVTLPESLTEIREFAFCGCDSLTSIMIPKSVTSIGYVAFNSKVYDEDDPEIIIYGYAGSYAERYAEQHEHKFIDLSDSATEILSCTVTLSDFDYKYDGTVKKPNVIVKNGKQTLTKGVDYTVSYHNNINAGTGKVYVTGIGGYTGTVEKSFTIKKGDNIFVKKGNPEKKISNVSKVYSKKKQNFQLGVQGLDGAQLDFKSDNSAVTVSKTGKATIKAGFIGEATITITAQATANCNKTVKKIKILANPAKVKLNKVKNIKKAKMAVKWKKDNKITGYEIQYSTDKNFVKKARVKTIKKKKKVFIEISKLSRGKTYYVRIRSYKIVGRKKFYSDWSGRKKVKISK